MEARFEPGYRRMLASGELSGRADALDRLLERCAFCQNADISQRPEAWKGRAANDADLAGIMLELQNRGCHNRSRNTLVQRHRG